MVARLGGDEFIMVQYKPFDIKGNIVKIGCSIGGAVWPSDGIDTTEVVRLADEALYISKRTGKNKTTFHQDYDCPSKEEYSV